MREKTKYNDVVIAWKNDIKTEELMTWKEKKIYLFYITLFGVVAN